MNAPWSYALSAGLTLCIGLLVAISTPSEPADNGEGAMAIALEDSLSEFIETLPVEENGVLFTYIPVCLVSDPTVDFALINTSFTPNTLVVEPMDGCTSLEPGEGTNDTAFPQYFHPDKEQALDLTVEVQCQGESRCVVEIDELYRKDRYTVLRRGARWRILGRENLVLRDISPTL